MDFLAPASRSCDRSIAMSAARAAGWHAPKCTTLESWISVDRSTDRKVRSTDRSTDRLYCALGFLGDRPVNRKTLTIKNLIVDDRPGGRLTSLSNLYLDQTTSFGKHINTGALDWFLLSFEEDFYPISRASCPFSKEFLTIFWALNLHLFICFKVFEKSKKISFGKF